jgi:hypothetical protein
MYFDPSGQAMWLKDDPGGMPDRAVIIRDIEAA